MNAEILNRNIKGYLSQLSDNVAVNNALGLYDINKHSEGLVAKLLNILFDIQLEEAEDVRHPGIDLIDLKNKTTVQVSSTIRSDKITDTCSTFVHSKYYNLFDRLIFYFLTHKKVDYYNVTLEKVKNILGNNVNFNFDRDIINNDTIFSYIEKVVELDKICSIENLLSEELALPGGGRFDPNKGYIIPKKLNSFAGYALNELVGREDVLTAIHDNLVNRDFYIAHRNGWYR